MLYPAKFGAYTELYAGLAPDITPENNGCYIIPWGRMMEPRADLRNAMKGKDEGGAGTAAAFWDWCETQTSKYGQQ